MALLLVSLHRPVAQPQREGRVGIVARPFGGEPGLGDEPLVALLHRLDVALVHPADLARVGIDQLRQLDHRIRRGIDRRLAAFEQLPAHGQVLEPGARDQLPGQLLRRLLSQHLAHHRIVGAERLAQLGEREAQPLHLVVVVDRSGGEELLLERRQGRVGELAEPLLVGLGKLLGRAQERARVAEVAQIAHREPARPAEAAAGGLRPFQVAQPLVDLPLAHGSAGDLVPGGGHVALSLRLRPQRVLALDLGLHQRVVDQRLAAALQRLVAVLDEEVVRLGGAGLFRTAPLVLAEEAAHFGQIEQGVG